MNKYQEALDELVECAYGSLEKERAKHLCIVKDLQELVDKATPKKPIFEDFDYYLACSKCWQNIRNLGSMVTDESLQPEYCPNCGQHIDWSENE